MLRTMDEMRRTGRTGWVDGRVDERTGRRMGAWVGGRAGEWAHGQADERTGRLGLRAGTRTGGRADGGGQWADGAADGRTGGQRISEGKIPNLMRQLTWPSEIQRGRPWVTIKLPHLPPPSRYDRVRHDVVPSSCRFCRNVVTEQGPS